MASISKDLEIELSDGTLVEGTLTVSGFPDDNYGDDRGTQSWTVEGFSFEHNENITDGQQEELDGKIEDMVYSEAWEFEESEDQDLDDDFGF